MTKALILGANGFSGRHLARRLAEVTDTHIFGADIIPQSGPFDDSGVVDIGNREQVERVVRDVRPDWIFNLAGMVHGAAEDVYRTNVMGTVYLLESVRQYVPEARVLLVGSSAEYGPVSEKDLPVTEEQVCRPIGAYGASKAAATLAGQSYARQYGLKVVIARPFNIIGSGIPERLVLGAILQRTKETLSSMDEPTITVGNIDTQRDFVDVEDVADAYVAMIQGEHWGEVFNLCSGRPISIRHIIELALAHSPRPVKLEVDPALLRSNDAPVFYGSLEKARRAFGFHPRKSIEDSVKAAWDWVMGGGG